MRRGSATVVALVGEVSDQLVTELARSANVTVAVAPPEGGLDAAVGVLREAAGRTAPFVLVAADPLAAMAEGWRAMWDTSEAGGPTGFEQRAGAAVLAWRAGRFELPDYYVVVAREPVGAGRPHPHDLYLGVLASERPSRVLAVAAGEVREAAERVRHALRSLPQGPWWPALDDLVATARSFFPGALSAPGNRESDQTPRW